MPHIALRVHRSISGWAPAFAEVTACEVATVHAHDQSWLAVRSPNQHLLDEVGQKRIEALMRR